MIKCYDASETELGTTIEDICDRGTTLVLETDEDCQELKRMIEESRRNYYRICCDKIFTVGTYKYFDDYDRFLKEFSYRDACDILRLCSDKLIVCYAENDKYYVGVFDK